jgi:CRISPR/Cas system-associated exonuclease Cas4 (RecB family)
VLRISASQQTFTGWAIPHSRFAGGESRPAGSAAGSGKTVCASVSADDAFIKEKSFWAGSESEFPGRLFPVKKQGFRSWLEILVSRKEQSFDFLSRAFGAENAFLEERIKKIQWNVSLEDALDRKKRNADGEYISDKKFIRLSATDMNDFYKCPALWLFKKILAVPIFSLEAKLLDDMSLGILYHRILERLFIKIRKTDRNFQPAHLESYVSYLRGYAEDEVRSHPAFQGPLAVPLMVSQVDTITRRLGKLLFTEAEKLPEYTVSDFIEKYTGFARDDMIFVGKIDRVSVSPNDEPVIIDYKTSDASVPSKAASTESPDSPLTDFQMAMYVKLYEQEKNISVENGYFFSIHQNSIKGIFNRPAKEDPRPGREKYQYTLDAFEKYAEGFADKVKKMDFAATDVPFKTCAACDYKTVCRSCYMLNAPRPQGKTGEAASAG